MATRTTPGITVRHGRACRSRDGGNCNCDPTYEAWVFHSKVEQHKKACATHRGGPCNCDPTKGVKERRSFSGHGALAAAKGWRVDAMKGVKDRQRQPPSRQTLRQEVDEWLTGVRSGAILNKRNQRYKPAVIRNYELALRLRVLGELGDRRFDQIDLADLIELKEQLQGAGCSGSTIRNTFVPLQAIYRRARLKGRVSIDPTTDLPLPTSGRRDRAATPQEATAFLTAMPESVEALWACAFYSGLRRGELKALRVGNVDLEAGAITVEHSWDDKEGEIAPKSQAGARRVPILEPLRPYLPPLVAGRDAAAFVFGADGPFDARAVARKAERALDAIDKALEEGEPSVTRWTLHEARHSFSTWLDHAGVSPDRADRYMGHSSGSVASRYRHLLPSQLGADAELVNAYLAGARAGKVVPLAAAA